MVQPIANNSQQNALQFSQHASEFAQLSQPLNQSGQPQPQGQQASPATQTPPDADKTATDIINTAKTKECLIGGILCKDGVDGTKVGQKVATIAKSDPAFARSVFDKAAGKLTTQDKQEMAVGLTKGLSHNELCSLAGDANGRAILDSADAELRTGIFTGGKEALGRIRTSKNAIDIRNDPAFKRLDTGTQTALLDQIKRHETDPAAVDRIISLAKSSGFQNTTPATRSELLAAQEHHANDPIFSTALKKLAASPAFSRLSPAGQADAVRAFDQFANRDVYKGGSVSNSDKQKILDNAEKLVTSTGFHSVNPDVRNSMLDALQKNATDSAATTNLVSLGNSSSFQASSSTTQKNLIDALGHHAKDGIFREALEKLAGDPAFVALSQGQQTDAINALDKYASGEVYQGTSGVFGFFSSQVSDRDKRAILDNARKVVTSQGFHDVAPGARTAILDAMRKHATDGSFATRLVKLINDQGFTALNSEAKEVKLVNAYASDANFATGVDRVLTSTGYTTLTSGAARAQVLTDLTRLTDTDTYKDTQNKSEMTAIVGVLSTTAAGPASNAVNRNTLNQVLSGNIKLELYSMAPANGRIVMGYADGSTIHLNIHPQASGNPVDIVAHEVNHHINGDIKTPMPSADRLLAEYRAWNVGQEAVLGRPLTAQEQINILNNLVGPNSAYPELARFYSSNQDPNFTTAINNLYASLRGGTAVSPETLRQQLVTQYGQASTSYMNTPGNIDNH